jgi:hypothetical protein
LLLGLFQVGDPLVLSLNPVQQLLNLGLCYRAEGQRRVQGQSRGHGQCQR